MNGIDNILFSKSYSFALKIIKTYKFLTENKKEFVLSKQLLRSGTSIGAMVRESKFAQSRVDFINKLSIGLKEANETLYWLELLHDSDYLDDLSFESVHNDANELVSILVSIVKSTKGTNLNS